MSTTFKATNNPQKHQHHNLQHNIHHIFMLTHQTSVFGASTIIQNFSHFLNFSIFDSIKQ